MSGWHSIKIPFAHLTWWSRIFRRCILVPHFQVPHFPLLHFGAAFSCPAFSTPAYWCRIFRYRIFHPCIFDRPAFSCLAFSVAPWPTLTIPTFSRVSSDRLFDASDRLWGKCAEKLNFCIYFILSSLHISYLFIFIFYLLLCIFFKFHCYQLMTSVKQIVEILLRPIGKTVIA